MSRLFGKGRDDGGGGGPRADHQEAFACIADRRIPELGENEAPLMVRKAWPVGDIGLLMIIIAVAHPQETSCEGEKSANRARSEEHTSELQSLMRISYAVFCLKKKNTNKKKYTRRQAQKQ